MRAMQVAAYGEPLRLVEAPEPEVGPGEVLVDVHRAGVNFPDLLLIQGLYQARPEPPFGPGFEVAGVVAAIGDGVDHVAVGDRVVAFVDHGGYAERVVAPADSVTPIPDEVGFDEAAVLPIAYGTGYHALVDRARLAEGEVLLVLGASGGVGTAAVELGHLLGAVVVGVVGSERKVDAVRDKGADHVLVGYGDLRTRVRELTGGRGVDVLYDPVGGDPFDAALRAMAWQGRMLVIGFTSGRIPDIPANRLLLNETAALGVFWGRFAREDPEANRRNFATILEWVAEGRLRPTVTEVLPLEEAAAALERLASRRVVGKIVLAVR
ncbi:MAG TPA: NADPH:quinone oxidoreductase family protein [Actinobacteria bacterium]|nr:NADPH:quinone oxidoreductase family protein [Actinomycetota bacterium]